MAVALSHVNVGLHGYNIGVMAVVVFFLLSGYVVAGLLKSESALSHSPLKFYVERGVRLLPLYYSFLLMGGFVVWSGGAHSNYLKGHGNIYQWFANLFIVPLNYSMFSDTLNHFLLIPPAWSLGLEIQFYLLAPWLLRYKGAMFVVLVGSLLISTLAHLGILHTDWFGYRLLCGNLFIFLSGTWLYRMRHAQANGAPIVLMWCVCFFLWALTGWLGRWSVPFTFEVLTGYLVGVPVVAWLGHRQRKAWDEKVGHLAYGVFLCHFAVLWSGQKWGLINQEGRPLEAYLSGVLITALVAHAGIERWLINWRRQFRKLKNTKESLIE